MTLKKTHTIDIAAAKAGFSRATGFPASPPWPRRTASRGADAVPVAWIALIAPAGAIPVARIVLIVSDDRENAFAAFCFIVQ